MKTKISQVQVPVELWCRLCDALSTAPDNSIPDVVEKAELLQKLRARPCWEADIEMPRCALLKELDNAIIEAIILLEEAKRCDNGYDDPFNTHALIEYIDQIYKILLPVHATERRKQDAHSGKPV